MRDFKPIAIPLVHIFTEKQGNINDKTVEQYNCQVYSFDSLFVIHTRYLKNIFSQSVLSFDYLFVKICTRNSNGFKVSHQFKKNKKRRRIPF